VILDIDIKSDINISGPLDAIAEPANATKRINRFTEIRLHGSPIKDGDATRPPVLTKTYSNPAFRSLLKFGAIARVSLEDLTFTSKAASLDQTALSLHDIKSASLDNVKIMASAPSTAFTLGLSLRNTKLVSNKLSIDAANIGIQSQSSRIIARSRENRISTYRPADTKGLELNRSLIAADGLSLAADYNASMSGSSVLLTQALKLKGVDNNTSFGFLFENGASYALVSEKAESQDFYTDVWSEANSVSVINNQTVKSELKVAAAVCTNVQVPTDKICKKP
jgi:hypothetical protein